MCINLAFFTCGDYYRVPFIKEASLCIPYIFHKLQQFSGILEKRHQPPQSAAAKPWFSRALWRLQRSSPRPHIYLHPPLEHNMASASLRHSKHPEHLSSADCNLAICAHPQNWGTSCCVERSWDTRGRLARQAGRWQEGLSSQSPVRAGKLLLPQRGESVIIRRVMQE